MDATSGKQRNPDGSDRGMGALAKGCKFAYVGKH